MNIGIVGSRTFINYDTLKNSMNEIIKENDIKDVTIISGGAKGADTLGEAYAIEISAEAKIYKPNWNLYGKQAGFVRNHKIIDNSDVIVAYWDGYSHGTEHTIREAELKNKKVITLNYHYLNLCNCNTDKEKLKYLIKENPKNYTIWLDNDDTFITIGGRAEVADTIHLDDFLGNSKGVTLLLDLLGIYWSYV